MGKRGPKPKGKVDLEWSPAFAYAIGLIVSDGNLSPDGRHITFTSKDLELARHFIAALKLGAHHIGKKARGKESEKKYFIVQFSDVRFYRFLVEIGLMPKKSRLLQALHIPDNLFGHFMRGLFDGDGSTYSYWDPRWKSSFMYYVAIVSASPVFLRWLQYKILTLYHIRGAINRAGRDGVEQIVFAKNASRALAEILYNNAGNLYLSRKHLKLFKVFSILPPQS